MESGRRILADLGYSPRVLEMMPVEKLASTLRHHGYGVLASAVRLSAKSDAEQLDLVATAVAAGAGAPQRQPKGSGPDKGSAVGAAVERILTGFTQAVCSGVSHFDTPDYDAVVKALTDARPNAATKLRGLLSGQVPPEAIVDALHAYGIDWPPSGAAPAGLKGTWGRAWGTVTRDGAGLVIDAQPGNGTRYRLSVVVDGDMVRTIAWHDVGWSAGDLCAADVWAAGDWLAHTRNAPGRVDCEAIAHVVDDALHAAGCLK